MHQAADPPPLVSWYTARWIGGGFAAWLLLLTLLVFPSTVYDVDHDLSSNAATDYFALHGFQFGSDIVQNIGPLGWMHQTSVYSGMLHAEKTLSHAALRFVLVVLWIWVARRFASPWVAALWLLAPALTVVLGASELDFVESSNDAVAMLTVYLCGLTLLSARRGWQCALLLGAIGVLALQKHTLLMAAVVALASALLVRLRQRAWLAAAGIAVGAGFATVGTWLAAGQHLANLGPFAFGVWNFSAGYSESLAFPAAPGVLFVGSIVAAGLAALIVTRTALGSQPLAKGLLDAGLVALAWKHGFVRADSAHNVVFFEIAWYLAWPIGLLGVTRADQRELAAPRVAGRPLALLTAVIATTSVLGWSLAYPTAGWSPTRLVNLVRANLAWTIAPGTHTATLDWQLQEMERSYALPRVRELVGAAPIDFFGAQPGWILLNHLRYAPRPMPITFAAANSALRRMNEAFLRDSKRAPPFVLVDLSWLPGRLVSLDDGLALKALLDLYCPVLTVGDLVLMGRREASSGSLRHPSAGTTIERTATFGEVISLETLPSTWVWVEAQIRRTIIGRTEALLLRPAPLQITSFVRGVDEPIVRDFFPLMAESGFLASPWIESSLDLLGVYDERGAMSRPVRAIRIDRRPEDARAFQTEIALRLSVATPPAPSPITDLLPPAKSPAPVGE